jgi:hypothetical protein
MKFAVVDTSRIYFCVLATYRGGLSVGYFYIQVILFSSEQLWYPLRNKLLFVWRRTVWELQGILHYVNGIPITRLTIRPGLARTVLVF